MSTDTSPALATPHQLVNPTFECQCLAARLSHRSIKIGKKTPHRCTLPIHTAGVDRNTRQETKNLDGANRSGEEKLERLSG